MADQTEAELQQDLFRQAMAPEPEPAPQPEPAAQPTEVQPPPPPEAPKAPPEGVEAAIPSWRLREEAEARRAAEDRARTLEQRLNEVAAHLQQQQPQKKPDFFENPEQTTQEMVLRTLVPFAEELRRDRMYNNKLIAGAVHGVDKVAEAEEAFLKAKDAETLDPVEYERVVQSPNRYDEVVKWHRRQATLSAVGDDPNAFFEKEFERRMADPQFQAKILQSIRGGAAAQPSAVRVPPSLSRAPAAAANTEPVGDLSDASLWAFARPDPNSRRQ